MSASTRSAEDAKTTSFVTKEQREAAKKFLARIKNIIQPATAPAIIVKILAETGLDALLPHIRDKSFLAFIAKLTKEPINLKIFIEQMENYFLNHEALCALLAFVEDKNLIATQELEQAAKTVQLQLNLLCLFEAFTLTMVNSKTLAEDVFSHVLHHRHCANPGNTWATFFSGFPRDTPLFDRMKIPSVDPAMAIAVRTKLLGDQKDTVENGKKFIEEHKLSSFNTMCGELISADKVVSSVSGMNINIIEALATDDKSETALQTGGKDNAIAGSVLVALAEELNRPTCVTIKPAILPRGTSLSEDGAYSLLPDLKLEKGGKTASEYKVPPEWVDLYNTWNCHFVIRNFKNILFPLKLLLPSVLAADVAFKETRTVSLFLFANIYVNQKLQKNPLFVADFKFANAKKILAEWGNINKQFANHILKKLCPNLDTTPEKLHQEIFGNHVNFYLLYHVMSFIYDERNFHCTVKERSHKKAQRTEEVTHAASNNRPT